MIHNVLQPSDAISNLVLYPTLMRGRTYLGSREENGTWINTFEANRFIHENLSPIDEFDPARGKKIEPIFQRTFQTSQTSFEIARYFPN